jgi:hypothetical protein
VEETNTTTGLEGPSLEASQPRGQGPLLKFA